MSDQPPQDRSVPVSVIVPVKNESANIAPCLDSLRWAGQVVVVDSHSTDGTIEAAQQRGATVVQFEWNGAYPKKKNWALENVALDYEWVLIVDADERATAALGAEIGRAIRSDQFDGYYVNRRFWFMGAWIRHCGYYPSWNLRLFKRALGRYERLGTACGADSGDNEVHEHMLLDGCVGYLRADLDHYAYPDLCAWAEKHNRYSSWEAHWAGRPGDGDDGARLPDSGLRRRRRLKRLTRRLPFRPMLRFLYHYGWKLGFLDGYRGFVLSRLMGWYEFFSIMKAKELARYSNEPQT